MARKYPRFLFSNPIYNTKSKGPFIIHTIHPKCLFSLVHVNNDPTTYGSKVDFALLENWDNASNEDLAVVEKDLQAWWKHRDRP